MVRKMDREINKRMRCAKEKDLYTNVADLRADF